MMSKNLNTAVAEDPQIVKNLNTGRCWQVDYFGEEEVGLRRGALVASICRVGLLDVFEVVC